LNNSLSNCIRRCILEQALIVECIWISTIIVKLLSVLGQATLQSARTRIAVSALPAATCLLINRVMKKR
jgi:hypothetical protein